MLVKGSVKKESIYAFLNGKFKWRVESKFKCRKTIGSVKPGEGGGYKQVNSKWCKMFLISNFFCECNVF